MTAARLAPDWILAPAIDRELKEYILLAYLQHVEARFAEHKLYPHLEELHAHLEQLRALRHRKQALARSLATPLLGMDLQRQRLLRAKPAQPEAMDIVDEVIAFSLPELQRMLERGSALREAISERIQFAPVGLLPLQTHEGYLLLRSQRHARAYAYGLHLLRGSNDALQYHSVHTRFLGTYRLNITTQYEHIKEELLARHPELPNPAMFVFETDISLPHIETYMPLAKQLMYAYVTPRA
jgi:hypothetical protein